VMAPSERATPMRRAAEGGSAAARTKLGACGTSRVRRASTLEQDDVKGAALFRTAADHGFPAGINGLAGCYHPSWSGRGAELCAGGGVVAQVGRPTRRLWGTVFSWEGCTRSVRA